LGTPSLTPIDAENCAGEPATFRMGELRNVHVPEPSSDGTPWYFNDHSIVRGPDGLWHMFGITHREPANPSQEKMLAHATSSVLAEPKWNDEIPALHVDPTLGETVLWAPHVIEFEGVFYMFYCAGGPHEHHQIKLATSRDLWSWQREALLFTDGFDARDPFVLRVGERWVLYYTATSERTGGRHMVSYRTSEDLRHWSEPRTAYVDALSGTFGGPTESPFVLPFGDAYYLFIGPAVGYSATRVFYSKDPFRFAADSVLPDPERPAHLPTHASEIVRDLDGSYYVTHAGWGQRGLWLAPLSIECPDGTRALSAR
jgi:arabinan endo-1,5-alpha-L-arabinosidase